MSRRGTIRFLPRRLPAVPARWSGWMRGLWFLALAFAIVLDIAATVFAVRDVYRNDPQFNRLSIASQIESDGSVTVATMTGLTGMPTIAAGSYITAIDGRPVARSTPVWELASRLRASDGQVVALRTHGPDGRVATHRMVASDRYVDQVSRSAPVNRDVRLATRMILSLLTCAALIACAVLLFLRRPHDPVALLFSFAFLLFAGSVDPPLLLWQAVGLGDAYDAYSTLGWVLLVVGIAAFPDGKFAPPAVRWVLLAAPILAVPLAIDEVPILLSSILAFVLPLFLLICHVIKYRRFQPGLERQQIKWAAFGFGSGLLFLTAAFFIFAATDAPAGPPVLFSVAIVAMFNFGFMAIALGLLVSLLRFRLWEADQVISRSAISAAVTLMVGVVWTLSTDLLKAGVEWVLGEENTTVATMAGAVLAAGIFAPTQALAMRWAKVRLEGDESRIRKLIGRLAVWRTTETPEEIGVRTLSSLHGAIHCSCSALLVDGPRGLRLLASRDLDQADSLDAPSYDPAADRRFVRRLPLEDEDGPIGMLLIGPRSDLNRYNAAQLEGLADLTEPLAEALRAALKRAQHAETVHVMLGSVEERLARLEQGGPKLSPT
jgi:hypothetical protein